MAQPLFDKIAELNQRYDIFVAAKSADSEKFQRLYGKRQHKNEDKGAKLAELEISLSRQKQQGVSWGVAFSRLRRRRMNYYARAWLSAKHTMNP